MRKTCQAPLKQGNKAFHSAAGIEIFFSSPRAQLLSPFSRHSLIAMLSLMAQPVALQGYEIAPVNLYLLNDNRSITLNRQSMNCNSPTNILSFPGNGGLPSELALSLDAWQRESLIYGQNAKDYFIFLLAHGMAHLAGLDHGDAHSDLEYKCFAAIIQPDRNISH